MGAPHLSRAEKKQIRQMRTEKKTIQEIAEALNRSAPAVSRALQGKRKYTRREVSNTSMKIDWRAKYLDAVGKLAEHGLI